MPTYSALTTLTAKEAAEALAEAIEERLDPEPMGVGVFEMEDGSGLWELGAFFTEAPDEAGLALLATLHGARPFTVSEVPETDWVAKVRRDLAPVEAGRFFLYGSHDADRVPEGPVPLLIEASMAFGTGHHGTTLGCLRAVDRLAEAGFAPRSVADIGCGTAVLAMAAAHLWQVPILASDIDPVAVEVAATNVAANGLSERIRCLEATGFDHPVLAAEAPFGLIFANILKAPLIDLAPEIAAGLAPGGVAILSGLLNEQAGDVAAAYTACALELKDSEQIGDWTTLCMQKPAT
ncbi:50S ribosomal protein L11 methyltransferase [Rhodovulum sulfidophilum]|uniref:Ribosomal protein L11 methyltransferase n=1 Tax=Rhodovulum sulfidophilum TaxID=35806 RepID=A0ABS1S0R5_RHOSU|nr:50S ribosomal protein L11 methyltransferase [Rhodovulum sulfidophilum]MBL3610925.1 50S ribosomal protein L11 methyltransferase [Rhodovulum sulfidophilum]MCE8457578.1 50S ribosomal protein L11 methyltransferase [Rhodovulum sulfidophilum]